MYILLNRGEKNLDSPFKIKNIWSKVRDARHVVLYLLLARVVLCITLFSANTQPLTTLQHAHLHRIAALRYHALLTPLTSHWPP